MSICLSEAEIQELTGKLRSKAQAAVLRYIGYPYKVRPDGSLIVLRVHVESMSGSIRDEGPRLHLTNA
jgi:hypothetical protein